MNRQICIRTPGGMALSVCRAVLLAALIVTMHATAGWGEAPSTVLPIGSPAPELALPGVDGHVHKLSDYSSSKVLAVVFLCNHCTSSQLYEERIERLATDYRNKGVTVLAIEAEPRDSASAADLAYSDVGDSLEDMKVRAAYRHFSFPYLSDGETQKVARLFGASVTPQIFIFDQARKLQYEGRIDDSITGSLVKTTDARSAIEALLLNKVVATPVTVAVGSPLRWATPSLAAEALVERTKQEAEPVRIALVGADGLTKLRTNGTGKLLLVNFFATWCGPCVSEFPDLIATYRMYRGRNFGLTTVSSNEPEEQADVLKFLQKMHASSTNLLFGTTDTYGLQAAFDPNMGAAVPFTVLMAPNGDILFQQQGDLDMMALRRAILANLPDDLAHVGSQAYWAREEHGATP
jgi:thiol-disulfide isomerase/thioredoxin